MLDIDRFSYHAKDSYNTRQRFLILHYTACDFQTSMDLLTNKVSTHYVVPQSQDPTYPHDDLKVFQLVDEHDRAWHAGQSFWEDRDHLNDTSIGIENIYIPTEKNGKYEFPRWCSQQIQLITALCLNILQRYPEITPTRVLAHSDIAYERKMDPGPMFPWKQLYEEGVGAWYEESTRSEFEKQFKVLPKKKEVIEEFVRFGYRPPVDDHDFQDLVRAFQMHYRPQNYDGQLDRETVSILFALTDRYRS